MAKKKRRLNKLNPFYLISAVDDIRRMVGMIFGKVKKLESITADYIAFSGYEMIRVKRGDWIHFIKLPKDKLNTFYRLQFFDGDIPYIKLFDPAKSEYSESIYPCVSQFAPGPAPASYEF